jgi:tRNA(fMet)-specific endonuclease VapC
MPGTGDIVLDTSVAVAHLRGIHAVTEQLESSGGLFLPIVALGELLYGVRKSIRAQENLSSLQTWLRTVTLLSLTEATADRYASIKHELARAGTPIPETIYGSPLTHWNLDFHWPLATNIFNAVPV